MERKATSLRGDAIFIGTKGNRCGLTARMISAAVSVQEKEAAPHDLACG